MEQILESFHDGAYAAKWGLTDLYEKPEAELRAVLLSPADFDTDWWGCKKEIRSCRIWRTNGKTHVQVSASSDDGADLFDTAIWKAAGGNATAGCGFDVLYLHFGRSLAGEAKANSCFEEMYDEAASLGLVSGENNEQDEASASRTPSYDKLMEMIEHCETVCERRLEARYNALVRWCKSALKERGIIR